MNTQINPKTIGRGSAIFFFLWAALMLVLSAVTWSTGAVAGAVFGVLFAIVLVGIGIYGWRNPSPIHTIYHEYDEQGAVTSQAIDERMGEPPPNESIDPDGPFRSRHPHR